MDVDRVIKKGLKLGASYVDVRYQEYRHELVVAENKVLKEFSKQSSKGVGIRVIVNGGLGFSSTNDLSPESIERCLRRAIVIAKVMSNYRRVSLAKVKTIKDRVMSRFKLKPEDVDDELKVKVVLEANKESFIAPEIKSASTYLGLRYDRRVFMSSEGTEVEVTTLMSGIHHLSVAKVGEVLERVPYHKSAVTGWEFIEKEDWVGFTQWLSKLAIEAVKSKTPPPGTYKAVIDSNIIGLLLHEAFGHASEGDEVIAGASVLKGKVGTKVASELVTIVDDGLVEGGYFVPYDDEGVPKKRTVIVENGVLKHYLTSRAVAHELGMEPTGNGRAQDFENLPLVRQTNYFMLPGDYSLEELIEDIDFGIYIKGVGATGGEVDPGVGTFTFGAGPSYIIRNGRLAEMVRGVAISGEILSILKEIDAVGKDLMIRTSVFGGCGKEGQVVKVGAGGPPVRVRKITIGGR